MSDLGEVLSKLLIPGVQARPRRACMAGTVAGKRHTKNNAHMKKQPNACNPKGLLILLLILNAMISGFVECRTGAGRTTSGNTEGIQVEETSSTGVADRVQCETGEWTCQPCWSAMSSSLSEMEPPETVLREGGDPGGSELCGSWTKT